MQLVEQLCFLLLQGAWFGLYPGSQGACERGHAVGHGLDKRFQGCRSCGSIHNCSPLADMYVISDTTGISYRMEGYLFAHPANSCAHPPITIAAATPNERQSMVVALFDKVWIQGKTIIALTPRADVGP